MSKFNVEMNVSHEFSTQDISDLVVTALEGGINYWCRKAVIKKDAQGKFLNVPDEDQEKVKYASDVIGYGGTLVLYDAESSDKWELTPENMMKGIKMHCENSGIAPSELMDSYDAGDADNIIQYALFDELVFG